MNNQNLLEILTFIDPTELGYQEWCNIGMALKEEGFTASDWNEWSKRDGGRFHSGECFTKWTSFNGSGKPVTAGTIVQMAKDRGWTPSNQYHAMDWGDSVGDDDSLIVFDKNWVEGKEVEEPKNENWKPVDQLVKYLETLFDVSENVGYVCESWEKDGRFMPTKGPSDRTAGKLIQELNKCNGDIGAVLGDYNEEVGAWIRFNPLDGKGVKNENVTEFRYALVESDVMDIDQQNAIIRELELPVACLTHSGKKSLHAIVKIDAADYDEYRKRVDYLYTVCKKNGLEVDSQNRNPSRLSRMPGVMRDGQKQFLIDTNIGKGTWKEWEEWIESINDNLPDPESLAGVWDNLPDLAPPLISNVLRQGHKMMLAGPSKAGKSFALIELCCAIAEGKKWLNWDCARGKIMYVNLELDRASCLHRFKDVYAALEWEPNNLMNIDIWNLRGKSVPMDKLAPKLIRRAIKKNYIAIIIDPIYKVITGDENSADQMANFCNQFDRVCTELGSAVIYCHHHSKGGQGGKKSMDRASGSGVFARDPDVLMDLIELEISDKLMLSEENKAACIVCETILKKYIPDYKDEVPQDDWRNENAMLAICESLLNIPQNQELTTAIEVAKKNIKGRTAWRIDGTLREFPKFPAVNLWFDYPRHILDNESLEDVGFEGDNPAWQKNFSNKKNEEERKEDRIDSLDTSIKCCGFDGPVTVATLAQYLTVTEKTVRRRVKEHPDYDIFHGEIMGKIGDGLFPSGTK